MQSNFQSSQAHGSWVTNGDDTYSSNASPSVQSPPSFAPRSAPQESVFARFKKEADAKDHSALLSPFSSKYETRAATEIFPNDEKVAPEEKPHTLAQCHEAKKTIQEKLFDATGVSSLKHFERSLLLGLLVLSPVLAYVAERLFLSHVVPAGANGMLAVVSAYKRAHTELSSMSLRDFAVASALAVLLSVVFDRNTRATDARIRQGWTSLTSYLANRKSHFSPIVSENMDQEESSATRNAAWSLMQSLLSKFERIPLFVRFAVTIAIFGGVFRVVLGKAVEAASVTLVQFAPVLSVLAALLVWLAVGWGLSPLQSMVRLLKSRAPDSLSPLVVGPVPIELEAMVASINRLMVQANELLARERRFLAYAAHELRTPLTVLRIQAHNAAHAPDAADRGAALKQLDSSVLRATRVVEQLLTLARLEPGAAELDLQAINMLVRVREQLAELTPLALGRHQELTLDAPEHENWQLLVDAHCLDVLLQNLVSNAVQHTPDGGQVVVCLQAEPDAVTLCVQDSGPGVAPEQRDQVFEPFFRQGPAQGAGLGLAIVARIVDLHAARISLGDSPQGGLQVCVRWPRKPAVAP